tara:strand:- start:64105 stop:66543 length:2439 start_codon:yes stop_codon:yes gene_type:complete
MFKRFTERARKVIVLAREEAEKNQHEYLGTEHLLLGVLNDSGGVAIAVLQKLDVDLKNVKAEVERLMPISSNTLIVGDIPFTARAKKVLEYSVEEARSMGHSYIGTEHLLLGLVREKDGLAAKVLNSFGVSYVDVREQSINLLREPTSGTTHEKQQAKTPALDEFGRDLTELALKDNLDPVIGREKEIERVIQILARRTKNNPVLIGEPGVGKTAIVEGMAQRIFCREVPQLLHDRRVISLDLGAVIAGTKYRGQFEQRIKAIMKEVTQTGNIILFIDEIHTLVGAGAAEGSVDASNMLKPALSRGEIQCIGATTLDEYRKYIEKNGALERRFQPIIVQPPNVDETIEILKGLRPKYEAHHKATITDSAVVTAVKLADRYISDRFLPDKAIDVIDEAGSRVHLKKSTYPPELRELQVKIDSLALEKREKIEKQEFELAVEIRDEEEGLRAELENINQTWEQEQEASRPTVSEEDIAYVVSSITGIPLNRIEKKESEKLQVMAKKLKEKIIGQDEAVDAVCNAIRRSRMGLKEVSRPMGTFLFLGPTGVGKTELANVLAEYMFGDRSALIRLDMSEYMEKFAASRLVGAPPGYVGYEEGGQLTERVRRKPYAVVLLDEMEKAHADIYHMLLQIMDEGRLTDSYGRSVSFKNVTLILTSNLSARIIEKGSVMGFQLDDPKTAHEKMTDGVKAELKRTFNPEFLNRLDEVVTFHKLGRDNIESIFNLQLVELGVRLKEEGLLLELEEDAKQFIISEGFDSQYGARQLKRTLQRLIENPLSEEMLFGRFKRGSRIYARLEDDKLIFDEKNPVVESV